MKEITMSPTGMRWRIDPEGVHEVWFGGRWVEVEHLALNHWTIRPGGVTIEASAIGGDAEAAAREAQMIADTSGSVVELCTEVFPRTAKP